MQPNDHPEPQRTRATRFGLERWVMLVVSTSVLLGSIGWGLPNADRVALLLGGGSLTDRQEGLLTSLRESHYSGRELPRGNGSELSELERVEAFRAFLIGSEAVDERKPYSALSRMNPGRLDLDPKIYLYGGSFLYPIGTLIVVADAVGWLTIHREFHRYLERPEDAARLYILGRSVSIAAFLGVLVFLGVVGDGLGGRWVGSFAMLAWCFSTLALNQAIVTKPHVYAAFWSLLAVFFVLRGQGRFRDLVCGGLAGGLAVGASLPAGLTVLFLPILADSDVSVRGRTRATAVVWGGGLAAFLASNPYLPFALRNYVKEVLAHGSSESWGYAQVVLAKLPGYLSEVAFRAYGAPLSVVGLLAALSSIAFGMGRLRRLGLYFLLQLLVIGLTVANLRISLFLGPVLCLFTGVGLAWLRCRMKRMSTPLVVLVGLILFSPPVLFTLIFVRDTLLLPDRPAEALSWYGEVAYAESTSYGIDPPLHPVKTPPFPFLNSRVVRLDRITAASHAPEWVIVGNHDGGREEWERHPLRDRYELALVIGSRLLGEWGRRWRMENQAYKVAAVYRSGRRRAVVTSDAPLPSPFHSDEN